MLARLTLLVMFGSLALASTGLAQGDPNWTRPFPPFRIVGNIYNPDQFVDPQGFKAAVEQLEKTYREQLARERAAK